MNAGSLLEIKRKNYYWFLSAVLVFYLFTAYRSSGFHHPDEHFQIIEFANYKLGSIKASGLAWEFHARIRPGLQPMLCYLLFKLFHFFSVTDVYQLTFLLRAVTAVFAVFVIHTFVCASAHSIDKKYHQSYILLSFLLWFLPYINVRFSSEAWSGLTFMLALALLTCLSGRQVKNKQMSRSNSIAMGLVCGFSILFRYQAALMVAGMVLWLFFIAKVRLSRLTALMGSCLLVLIVGVFIDKWLYGVYTFTLYHYFYVNVIRGVASHYGTAPWYRIILYIINAPGPVGIFIFLSFIFLLLFRPRHLIVWVVLPFLLVHAIVPHKELRFLFPVAGLAPFFIILAWQEIVATFHLHSYKWLSFIIAVLFMGTNMAGLLIVCSKGAGNTRVSLTEYIHRHYDRKCLHILYIKGHNPYYDWVHPENTFYNSSGIFLTPITTVWQQDLMKKIRKGLTNLLVLSPDDITGPKTLALLKQDHFVRKYQSIPFIDQKIIAFYNPSINNDNLILYEYRP